jgi:hypothetical protein
MAASGTRCCSEAVWELSLLEKSLIIWSRKTNHSTMWPKSWLRAESCANAKRRLLLDKTILAYETRCWNWKRTFKYSNWEYSYANVFVVLAEGHDMFRLVTVATGGKVKVSGNLSFTKRTFVVIDIRELNAERCDLFGWMPLRIYCK